MALTRLRFDCQVWCMSKIWAYASRYPSCTCHTPHPLPPRYAPMDITPNHEEQNVSRQQISYIGWTTVEQSCQANKASPSCIQYNGQHQYLAVTSGYLWKAHLRHGPIESVGEGGRGGVGRVRVLAIWVHSQVASKFAASEPGKVMITWEHTNLCFTATKTWATYQGFCKEQQLLIKVSALSWMQHWKKCFIPHSLWWTCNLLHPWMLFCNNTVVYSAHLLHPTTYPKFEMKCVQTCVHVVFFQQWVPIRFLILIHLIPLTNPVTCRVCVPWWKLTQQRNSLNYLNIIYLMKRPKHDPPISKEIQSSDRKQQYKYIACWKQVA